MEGSRLFPEGMDPDRVSDRVALGARSRGSAPGRSSDRPASVHVVRNGYFGDERKFELYNASKVRAAVESRGGKSVTLPDLADRVADDLYTQRLAISAAAKLLPLGNRAELFRWRGEVRTVIAALLAKAPAAVPARPESAMESAEAGR